VPEPVPDLMEANITEKNSSLLFSFFLFSAPSFYYEELK
jgi:hypothetical protein